MLAGVSAGSVCWHVGGTTDWFARPATVFDGLGLLPYSNGVHYDSEALRRPLFQRLVADGRRLTGTPPKTGSAWSIAAHESVEVVAEMTGKAAYSVRRDGDRAVEDRIEPRKLPGSD